MTKFNISSLLISSLMLLSLTTANSCFATYQEEEEKKAVFKGALVGSSADVLEERIKQVLAAPEGDTSSISQALSIPSASSSRPVSITPKQESHTVPYTEE